VLVAYHEEKAYTKVLNILKRASSDQEELVDAARRESARFQPGEPGQPEQPRDRGAELGNLSAVSIAASPLGGWVEGRPGAYRGQTTRAEREYSRSRSAEPSYATGDPVQDLSALVQRQAQRISALEALVSDVRFVAVMAYNSMHPTSLLRPPNVPARLFLSSRDAILTRRNQGIIDDTLRAVNEYLPGERLDVRQAKVLRVYGLDSVQSGGTSESW